MRAREVLCRGHPLRGCWLASQGQFHHLTLSLCLRRIDPEQCSIWHVHRLKSRLHLRVSGVMMGSTRMDLVSTVDPRRLAAVEAMLGRAMARRSTRSWGPHEDLLRGGWPGSSTAGWFPWSLWWAWGSRGPVSPTTAYSDCD